MKVKHLIYIIALCFIVKYNIIYVPIHIKEFGSNEMSDDGAIGLLLLIIDVFIALIIIDIIGFAKIKSYWHKLMNKEI